MATHPDASSAIIAPIRTTLDVKHSLAEKAKQAGMSLKDYLIACALNRPLPTRPSELNIDGYGELTQQTVSFESIESYIEQLRQHPGCQEEAVQTLLNTTVETLHQQQALIAEVRGLLIYGKSK